MTDRASVEGIIIHSSAFSESRADLQVAAHREFPRTAQIARIVPERPGKNGFAVRSVKLDAQIPDARQPALRVAGKKFQFASLDVDL